MHTDNSPIKGGKIRPVVFIYGLRYIHQTLVLALDDYDVDAFFSRCHWMIFSLSSVAETFNIQISFKYGALKVYTSDQFFIFVCI